MQCDQIRRYLEQYAEGSLPGYKAAWVVQHLAGCPACTTAAEEARRDPVGSTPAAAAIEHEPNRPEGAFEAVQRPVPRWLQWATAILIVVAVGGAVWLLQHAAAGTGVPMVGADRGKDV